MDSLIAIGSSAAIVYGIYAVYKIGIGFGHGDMATVHSFMMDLYFESAGMILTLITLAIALTDAILVVITVSMMLYEFGKLPETSSVNR